jgi:molybdenum cofactor cytidylyltransferase
VTISAVVLAAGSARRFGSDKLVADLDGKPVFQHVLDGLGGFAFHEVVAVVRPGSQVWAPQLRLIENTQAADGMGRSLALGISSLKPCAAAFVILADMPFLPAGIFDLLADGLSDRDIVLPRHNGQAGHPVLFSNVCFPDLQRLEGDRGGRTLIDSGRYRVHFIDSDSDGVLRDIDRPADLRR